MWSSLHSASTQFLWGRLSHSHSSMSGALFDKMWDGEGRSGYAYFNVTEPSSNTTLSCAARSIQSPVMLPYSTALTITVRAILAMYYIITTLAGIILNTLVIVLVAKYKKLHTHSFAVALQVVGVDLVRCLVFLAGQINVVANRWVFGKFVCDVTGVLVETITHVHLHLMFVLVLDRYLSTFYRSFYLKHKVKVTVSVSIATWLFAILSYAPLPPRLSDCIAFDRFKWVCAYSSSCKSACFDILLVPWSSSLSVLPPTSSCILGSSIRPEKIEGLRKVRLLEVQLLEIFAKRSTKPRSLSSGFSSWLIFAHFQVTSSSPQWNQSLLDRVENFSLSYTSWQCVLTLCQHSCPS